MEDEPTIVHYDWDEDEFVKHVEAGDLMCGCGDHGQSPDNWCLMCWECVDCCATGECGGFRPVSDP